MKKIDKLLEIDCSLYAHLGTDSTKEEKEEVKRKSIDIYRTIKTLDKKMLSYAAKLEFEDAARLRDEINRLK